MNKIEQFQEFLHKCKYVLNVTQKPSMRDFKKKFLVSMIGILFIGFIGFIVAMLYMYFTGSQL